MTGTYRILSTLAAVALALAVVMGAFGAHALKGRLDAYAMSVYEKAVLYHFIHALGMLIVLALPGLAATRQTGIALVLFAGTVIFSGSLYALALSGIRLFGAITPIGGISFIAGWIWLAWSLWRERM